MVYILDEGRSMPQYVYAFAPKGDVSSADMRPIEEFEGPANVILARRKAEKDYGPGGRLFIEVVSGLPAPTTTPHTSFHQREEDLYKDGAPC
jgi:hypothetical protein